VDDKYSESKEMNENLTAKATIAIHAPAEKVWEALTTPLIIKEYLFGTDVKSDWKEGSSITYRGQWQGKTYEDKGKILRLIPNKLFVSTYWSSMGGLEDKPENYATVTYELMEENGQTLLNLTQDNNTSEQAKNHSQENWSMVLGKLKEILEK
jgi:uncharacterized protein YndB with AHSA1/START domain